MLASGRGSHFQTILRACRRGELPAEVVLLVSRLNAPVVERAHEAGVPVVFPPRDEAICSALQDAEVDWVVLAGYLRRVGPAVLAAYPERVINIHPALLPAFGGQGMYGRHVHEAVLAAGVRETGASVHLVDEEYDQGRLLAQMRIPVLASDTPESLADRVLEVEHRLYLATLASLLRKCTA